MKTDLRRWLVPAAILLAIAWIATHPRKRELPTERPAQAIPVLLEPRPATAEKPLQSWERLLARDGSPSEDRAALAEMVANYLQSAPDSQRPPLGANDEITRALSDRNHLGEAALPAAHPAIARGQLVDRWGHPWHFHQLSADVIEVRSAGPDGRLFTEDDIREGSR